MKTRTIAIVLGLIGFFLVIGYTAAYVIPENESCMGQGFVNQGGCSMKYVSGANVYCVGNGGNAGNCENQGNGCEDNGTDCTNYDDCPEYNENCTDCYVN